MTQRHRADCASRMLVEVTDVAQTVAHLPAAANQRFTVGVFAHGRVLPVVAPQSGFARVAEVYGVYRPGVVDRDVEQ